MSNGAFRALLRDIYGRSAWSTLGCLHSAIDDGRDGFPIAQHFLLSSYDANPSASRLETLLNLGRVKVEICYKPGVQQLRSCLENRPTLVLPNHPGTFDELAILRALEQICPNYKMFGRQGYSRFVEHPLSPLPPERFLGVITRSEIQELPEASSIIMEKRANEHNARKVAEALRFLDRENGSIGLFPETNIEVKDETGKTSIKHTWHELPAQMAFYLLKRTPQVMVVPVHIEVPQRPFLNHLQARLGHGNRQRIKYAVAHLLQIHQLGRPIVLHIKNPLCLSNSSDLAKINITDVNTGSSSECSRTDLLDNFRQRTLTPNP